MHARSALFDLYGDHLTSGGNWAPVAGIVRLLGTVDVAPAAVRTVVSRMVREGWLEPWDGQLAAAYRHFIGTTRESVARLSPDLTPERGFAIRTAFVHEWRKFLFLDPDLPVEVLPPDWPGSEAAMLFNTTGASLLPLAREFVDSCLSADVQTRS